MFSDVHADHVTSGFERDEEIDAGLVQIRRAQSAHTFDLGLFLGDWTDPDSDGSHRAASKAIRFSRSVQTPWIYLTGNHDVIEDGRGSHSLMGLAEIARVVAEPWVSVFDDTHLFVFLPYVSLALSYDPEAFILGEAAEVFEEQRKKGNARRVIVAGHMTNVPGVSFGSETTEMGRGRDMIFPVEACKRTFGDSVIMLNGHFHERVTTGPVLIPGSIARLTHGEERNQPSYLVVET